MTESTDTAETDFVPPYISFTQLENVFERMRNEGVPARIDRSYLSSWSGSVQGQFLKATSSLGLRDEHGRPTERLKGLVAEPDARPALMAEIIKEKYPEAMALGQDATQQQLEEVFRKYPGISGGTIRKSITFFLHATKFAGIPTSPFFKAPRQSTNGGGGSRKTGTRARRAAPAEPPPPPPSPADPLEKLHPAVITLVKELPEFGDSDDPKPEFSSAKRKAWFAYAKATFDLIYALPDGDEGDSQVT
jgi:Family of unknown function (DUF5343)